MSLNILRVRQILGRTAWFPPKPYGPQGWHMTSRNLAWTVVLSTSDHDGVEYIHASIAGFDDRPSDEQLAQLHAAVWGDHGHSYQVYPAPTEPANTLYLHGRSDGAPVLPQFSSETLRVTT